MMFKLVTTHNNRLAIYSILIFYETKYKLSSTMSIELLDILFSFPPLKRAAICP